MDDPGTGGHLRSPAIFMPALDRSGIDPLHWIIGRQERQTDPEARVRNASFPACIRIHLLGAAALVY